MKRTFVRHTEEHMDMVSGKIRKEEVRYPMKRVCFAEDDVGKGLRAIKAGKQQRPDKLNKW